MAVVTDLMNRIRAGGAEGQDAAMNLGLLIERERTSQPAGAWAGTVLLTPGIVQERLSPTEVDRAIDELIAYVSDATSPHPTAVWALGKSNDPRPAGALAALLRRNLADEQPYGVAYQALIALCDTGGGRHLDVIREAAREGVGQMGVTARQYLEATSG